MATNPEKDTKNMSKQTHMNNDDFTQPELLLITDEVTPATRWTLDDHTREIGRKGIADARAALRAARPAHLDLAA